jgi:hypothetical protein
MPRVSPANPRTRGQVYADRTRLACDVPAAGVGPFAFEHRRSAILDEALGMATLAMLTLALRQSYRRGVAV